MQHKPKWNFKGVTSSAVAKRQLGRRRRGLSADRCWPVTITLAAVSRFVGKFLTLAGCDLEFIHWPFGTVG